MTWREKKRSQTWPAYTNVVVDKSDDDDGGNELLTIHVCYDCLDVDVAPHASPAECILRRTIYALRLRQKAEKIERSSCVPVWPTKKSMASSWRLRFDCQDRCLENAF